MWQICHSQIFIIISTVDCLLKPNHPEKSTVWLWLATVSQSQHIGQAPLHFSIGTVFVDVNKAFFVALIFNIARCGHAVLTNNLTGFTCGFTLNIF